MNVTYKYKDLGSLADYLDNKARDLRAAMVGKSPNSHPYITQRAEAATYESIAYMLRHTELENTNDNGPKT